MQIIYLFISFIASSIGSLCGLGGGVIIKPVLDFANMATVETINFLSGSTVLAMSSFSVIKNRLTKENKLDLSFSLPLAIGASIGGIIGKELFNKITVILLNQELNKKIQSLCLCAITLGALIYTLKKSHIKPYLVKSILAYVIVGLLLGIISSFLGIGGGPINLIVLYHFFGLDTKTAVNNSLFIILLSQFTSLATTVITKQIPEFNVVSLILMITGGLLGGFVGGNISKRLKEKNTENIFVGLMVLIIGVCIFNTVR